MFTHRSFVSLLLTLFGSSWIATASACDIPLYRFALEQWMADAYLVQILHHGKLSPDQQALVDDLQKKCYDSQVPANFGV